MHGNIGDFFFIPYQDRPQSFQKGKGGVNDTVNQF